MATLIQGENGSSGVWYGGPGRVSIAEVREVK